MNSLMSDTKLVIEMYNEDWTEASGNIRHKMHGILVRRGGNHRSRSSYIGTKARCILNKNIGPKHDYSSELSLAL